MSLLDEIEDLDIFTGGEFSDRAIIDSPTSDLRSLSGIFDENYQDIFDVGSQTAEGRKFCFKVQTNQVKDLRHGDRLTIKSKNYLITSLQPKDDGKLTNIILKQEM